MPMPSLPPGSSLLTTGAAQPSNQRSRIKPDDHQRAIIECSDKVVVANAFAGSGKTTMAEFYAAARPTAQILYVVFGKANQLVAKARFGKNVDCRTGHSLAYEAIGHRFEGRNQIFLPPQDFARQLNMGDARKAAVVLDILNQWCVSSSATITADHLQEASVKWGFDEREFVAYKALARLAWSKVVSPGSIASVLPDFYLKMWALSRPKLSRYTHIILDEAQDTNPVMA